MSGKIMIQYEAVYAKVAELYGRIETELLELEATYRQAQSDLQNMDGKANAIFMETMIKNQVKAQMAAETLCRLLAFIEASARQVEHDERIIKSMFTLAETGKAEEGSVI